MAGFLTYFDMINLQQRIAEYRDKNQRLPRSLNEVYPELTDPSQFRPRIDGWRNPIEYSSNGSDYILQSYGRDGKPGGVGLDRDVIFTAGNPPVQDNSFKVEYDLRPTFWQFVANMDYVEMLAGCVAGGLCAGALCLVASRPARVARRRKGLSIGNLLAIVIGSLIIAIFLAFIHVPNHH